MIQIAEEYRSKKGVVEALSTILQIGITIVILAAVATFAYGVVDILPQVYNDFLSQTTTANVNVTTDFDQFHGVYIVGATYLDAVNAERIEFRGDVADAEGCVDESAVESLQNDYKFNLSVSEVGDSAQGCLPSEGGDVVIVAYHDDDSDGTVVYQDTVESN